MQVCTSLQTDNHASTPPLSFLQAGCPFCCPTNSIKALKAVSVHLFWNKIDGDRQSEAKIWDKVLEGTLIFEVPEFP